MVGSGVPCSTEPHQDRRNIVLATVGVRLFDELVAGSLRIINRGDNLAKAWIVHHFP